MSNATSTPTNRAGVLHDLVRQSVMKELPHTTADEAALQKLSVQDLLTAYYTWAARQISARPRRVHVSAELASKQAALPLAVQVGLTAVLDAAAQGADLRRHLSTGSACGFDRKARAKPGLRRGDLDLLLGSWGLHHLHLSTSLRPDGWGERTAEVLIAAVQPGDFFAVNVVPHGAKNDRWWTVRPDLLSMIARNWPERTSLLRPAQTEMRVAQTFGLEEQLQLRQAGVTVLTEAEGRVCLPGAIAVDGTPLASTRRAQKTMWLLGECERRRSDLEAQAAELARNVRPGLDAQPTWDAELTSEADVHLLYGGAVRFPLV